MRWEGFVRRPDEVLLIVYELYLSRVPVLGATRSKVLKVSDKDATKRVQAVSRALYQQDGVLLTTRCYMQKQEQIRALAEPECGGRQGDLLLAADVMCLSSSVCV